MKKIYLIFIIITSAVLSSPAQTITSFTIVPSSPTTADTVKIYIQCDFPNKDCDGVTFLNGINGNVIDAGALHCMGSLVQPCTDYDTVVVPPLTAGQYTLIFVMSTGITAGCIPNIIPIVIDSAHFTVSSATGIHDLSRNNILQIIPNPSNGKFIVKQITGEKSLLKIFSIEGKLIKSFLLTNNEMEINSSFPPGVYTILTESHDRKFFSKLIVMK